MIPITRLQVLGLVIALAFWMTWFWPDISGSSLEDMLKQIQAQKSAAAQKLP